MAIKLFTNYETVDAVNDSDYLLLHDGNGVKKTTAETLLSESEILRQIAAGVYEGTDLTVKFADEMVPFASAWAWIQDRINNENFSGLHIFDYIPTTITGEEHKAQIAGISTYEGTSPTAVKAHIDFITKDCLSATVQFNTTSNNNGNSSNPNPFLASNLKSWLDNTVYPTLEEGLKAVIAEKSILAPYRYTSGSTLTDDNSWGWESFGKLWVPLECEIFDDIVWSTKGFGNGQSVQYPIFANGYKARIKGAGPGGDRCFWWTASAHSGSSTHVVIAASHGRSYYDIAADALCVPACFRVEKAS